MIRKGSQVHLHLDGRQNYPETLANGLRDVKLPTNSHATLSRRTNGSHQLNYADVYPDVKHPSEQESVAQTAAHIVGTPCHPG